MKIKFSQTTLTTKEVEKEISFPCFRKAIKKPYLESVEMACILGEREVVLLYRNAWNGLLTMPSVRTNDSEVGKCFSDEWEDATAEEFSELFKQSINDFGQAAAKFATDFIISVDSIPSEAEVEEMQKN